MGDDSAMECVNDNGRIKLFASWTYPKAEPYVSRFDSPQDIVQLLESSAIDGKLYCKFKRNTVSTVKGQVFDLANKKYNLMVLAGDSMKGWFVIRVDLRFPPYSRIEKERLVLRHFVPQFLELFSKHVC